MTNVPWAFAQVIEKLLRKEPADRYPSAVAVRTALEHALEAARAPGAAKADSFDGPLPEIVIAARARKAADRPTTDAPVRPSEEQMTARLAAVEAPAGLTPSEISRDLATVGAIVPAVPATAAPSLSSAPRRARLVPLVLLALAVVAIVAYVVYAATRGDAPTPPAPVPAAAPPSPDAAIVAPPIVDAAAPGVDAAAPAIAPDGGKRHVVPVRPPHTAAHGAPADAGVVEADAPF